jgi:hydroxymethylbilane synthase
MIRIGSRGSQLARWQAGWVADELHRLGQETAIEIIRTTGDRMQAAPFIESSGKGIFIREIEEALLSGAIDLAVHSLKDLPTELDSSFVLAAIPRRADARDAFVSEKFTTLRDLPLGALVGTSSLRRRAFLLHRRPDLRCIEFRGNVDTRLEKMAQGKADAIVLAAAGLDRLERTERIRHRFFPEEFCPAPGQGALAIECRANDERVRQIVAALDHIETRQAVAAERELLSALGGGCQTPVGAYARRADSGGLCLTAVVASADGKRVISGEETSSTPDGLGERLAQKLLAQGADELLGLNASS